MCPIYKVETFHQLLFPASSGWVSSQSISLDCLYDKKRKLAPEFFRARWANRITVFAWDSIHKFNGRPTIGIWTSGFSNRSWTALRQAARVKNFLPFPTSAAQANALRASVCFNDEAGDNEPVFLTHSPPSGSIQCWYRASAMKCPFASKACPWTSMAIAHITKPPGATHARRRIWKLAELDSICGGKMRAIVWSRWFRQKTHEMWCKNLTQTTLLFEAFCSQQKTWKMQLRVIFRQTKVKKWKTHIYNYLYLYIVYGNKCYEVGFQIGTVDASHNKGTSIIKLQIETDDASHNMAPASLCCRCHLLVGMVGYNAMHVAGVTLTRCDG